MENVFKLVGYDLFCLLIILIEDVFKKIDPSDEKYEKISEQLEGARILKNSYEDGTLKLGDNPNINNNA